MHCGPAYDLGPESCFVVTGDTGKITTFVNPTDEICLEESVYPLCGMTIETTVTPPEGLRPAMKVQPNTHTRRSFIRPAGDHE